MTERIRGVAGGLAVLLAEATAARAARAGTAARAARVGTAARAARAGVANGAEDAPTFYDWHNRPR